MVLLRAHFCEALIQESFSVEMLQPDSSGKQHVLSEITLHCTAQALPMAVTMRLLKTYFWSLDKTKRRSKAAEEGMEHLCSMTLQLPLYKTAIYSFESR